jgi:hypothetical protein
MPQVLFHVLVHFRFPPCSSRTSSSDGFAASRQPREKRQAPSILIISILQEDVNPFNFEGMQEQAANVALLKAVGTAAPISSGTSFSFLDGREWKGG